MNMPNRDGAADETAFIELIDRETEDRIDPGVRIFDQRITETEEFINDDGGIGSLRYEAALEALDDEWKFHGSVATLSGRVYVTDYILVEYVRELWGDPIEDEDGCAYFMVDDIELRSRGVVRGPHDYGLRDNKSDDAHRIRFGYGFSLPSEQTPYDQFVVYPGETSQHVYGLPSPEAIDIRLHRDWPEAMKLVDSLIVAGERETQRLPKRLELITRRLQNELISSADFRDWLAMYIDERIDFDSQWSVALTMRGPVTFVDEDEDRLVLEINESHTEHCFRPEVVFESKLIDDQVQIQAALIANFPNPIDQNCSDTFMVPVSSIESLRSTRRTISLVQVAMNAAYAHEPEPQATNVLSTPTPDEGRHELSESINNLRKLEEVLKRLTTDTRKVRRGNFSSIEAAAIASDKLCENFSTAIKQLRDYSQPLYVRGDGVSLPNIQVTPDAQSNSLIIKLDSDTPTGAPNASMEIVGYIDGIYPGVETIHGEDAQWYKPLPQLVIVIDHIPVQIGQAPIAALVGEVKKRALVRTDQFGTIKPAQLEMIDDFRTAFADFKRNYPGSKLTKMISRIKRAESALMKDEQNPTALNDISILKSYAQELERRPDEALDALEVVTKMFKYATTKITGDVYVQDRIIADYELAAEIEAVVAHVPNHPDTGPAFALQASNDTDAPIHYVPLKSVSHFLY